MQEKAESVVFPASPSVSENRGGCEPFTRAHLLHVLPFETLWLLCCCKEPPSDLWQRQHTLCHAGGIAPMKFHRLANILRCESDVCNDDVYLNSFRWYSWIGSLLQIGRQVLINVLKDQGEFGFSVSPRDRAHIKQPGNRGTYMREWVILNNQPHCSIGVLSENQCCDDADVSGENACRHRLSRAAARADVMPGKVVQLLPHGALNNSVYVCLTRQLTKARNPDYAEDFPRLALVKT